MDHSSTIDEGQGERQTPTIPRSWWCGGLVVLVVAAILPWIGHQLRSGQIRCALDGQQIDTLRQVTVVDKDGKRHVFCCITCTDLWLRRAKVVPAQVLVTDEITGQCLDSRNAYYARSSVISNAPTGDRRHVFARRDAAGAHVKSYRGRVLTGRERPFADLPSLTHGDKLKDE